MRLSLAAAALLVAGCQSSPGVTKHLYPREFRYFSDAEIASSMGPIARDAFALDALLHQPALDQDGRERIVSLLQAMDSAAGQLDAPQSNHPELAAHLPEFRRNISDAVAGARRETPDLEPANRVVQSCTLCHARR